MSISFDKALGVHPYALALESERSRVIAGNLANVETPGYLARDYDYKAVMKDVASAMQQMKGQQPLPAMSSLNDGLRYRIPMQPSQDGNTAELGVEQSKFAENVMDFQTSVTFLNLRLSSLSKAIEG